MFKTVSVLLAAAVWLTMASTSFAQSWQSVLETNFMKAETFDDLQDWTCNGQYPSSADNATAYNATYLPKKADGSSSMWGYWANKGPTPQVTMVSGTFVSGETVRSNTGATYPFQKSWTVGGNTYLQFGIYPTSGQFNPGDTLTGMSSGATAKMVAWPKMIGDHGASYDWGGGGKSLMMDLGDNDNDANAMKGIGAQRLGMFFGDGVTGKSGLKKAYLFMMMKFPPNFFAMTSSTNYQYVNVFKVADLLPGFTAINYFGPPTEHATVYPNPQNLVEYGTAGAMIDLAGGGASNGPNLFFNNFASYTTYSGGYYQYLNSTTTAMTDGAGSSDLQSFISSGQWFGVEWALDMGTLGNADGTTEMWIYDQTGAQKGYFIVKGQTNMVHFDHWINKMTLGGNRRTGSTWTSTTDGRYFIDDVVVDGNRIGPKYFQLLATSADTTAPTATISSPAGGATVSGTSSVAVSASDNVGVTKVQLYVDGSLVGTDTATPYNFSLNTTTLANGAHSLTAQAYDAAGNVGKSAAVSVNVNNVTDTTAPTVAISSPAASATVSGTTTVSMTASDNVGVSKVELYVNGSLYSVVGSSPYNCSWNTGTLSNGSCTLLAKAYDAAGNVGQSATVTVNVSNSSTSTSSGSTSTSTGSTGLVAAYSFNEGTGTTVADKSGNGNNGTLSNTTWTTGKYGNALSFNGTSSKVTINDSASLHLSSGMTLEAWVLPTRISTAWQDVIYKGADIYYLEATSPYSSAPGGSVKINGTSYGAFAPSALTANTWAHLAVTYDGSTVRLYVNGALVSSRSMSGTIGSSTYPLQIGGDSLYGEWFSGKIDEVRVFNVPRSQSQIQSDMQTPL
ncbi:MAG TPA: Ig-like domain-containing protein [Geomonas sp.]|nr:Ig-like domain-containing protein [Geomonas sp.]